MNTESLQTRRDLVAAACAYAQRCIGLADAERDAAAGSAAEFPADAFDALHAAGIMAAPLPVDLGGAGLGSAAGSMLTLLEILVAIGMADLSVGRVFEGHCNALHLIQLYGTRRQIEIAARDVHAGRIFAVWNTDAPVGPYEARPLELAGGADGVQRLAGAKTFCSGAGYVARPIVTAVTAAGASQMCIVAADRLDTNAVDNSVWRPLGMQGSLSGRVCFDGAAISPAERLGEPGDYARQPWFGGGAIRFAAVQLGGAAALQEIVLRELRRRGRASDPYQIARIGDLAIAIEGGRAWLDRAAAMADLYLGQAPADIPAEAANRALAHANMTRIAIERLCLQALDLATRAIGLSGLLAPHPLERRLRDLTTYLRQPGPDAALAAVGRHSVEDAAAS